MSKSQALPAFRAPQPSHPKPTDKGGCPLEPTRGQGGPAQSPELATRFAFPDFLPGSVWLVGAGPGDPGLLTLNGAHAIASADVILYDALLAEDCLTLARSGAVLEFVGKRAGKRSIKQADITARLISLAQSGKRVLRLKGGDPFVFGRGGEEAVRLAKAGVTFRIVPGVSSGIGGLAYAGVPVTHRGVAHAVTFVTGHDEKGRLPADLDWEALSRGSPTLVLFMARRKLKTIAEKLLKAGRSPEDPVLLVENAANPNQRQQRLSLSEAASAGGGGSLTGPVIICIGPVVALGSSLEWFTGAVTTAQAASAPAG